MNAYLNMAIRAAQEAGKVILRGMNKIPRLTIQNKGVHDFVSEIDYQAEHEILQVIKKAYPDHAILAEESGAQGDDSPYQWIIDPLDGTTNYLHGFPVFSTSIAMQYKGELQVAVVYNPWSDELFSAARGGGAFLNQSRLRVSKANDMASSLIGTGFPFRNYDNLDVYIKMLRKVLPQVSGVRRPGSAALDLAYLAAGRLDGFWEIGLSPWDIAAGVLLIEEAGGVVSDFNGGKEFLASGNIIAGNYDIHQQLLATIDEYVDQLV